MRQRLYIEVGIIKGINAIEIAKHLRFSRQTIYREIIMNSYLKTRRTFDQEITKPTCPKLLKFPFVCNTCPLKQKCRLMKRYYNAEKAHEAALLRLKNTRAGTRLSKGELLTLEENIGPGLLNGQSLHHIMISNEEKFNVGERTIRNLINSGELVFRNIDLPMTIRFKPRQKKYAYPKKRTNMPEVLLGRTYADFKDFIHFGDHYAQIDSVVGKLTEEQTIITIIFPTISFIFGFISPKKGWLSVNNGLLNILEKIGITSFTKIFPAILSDRGSQFDRLYKIEQIYDDDVIHDLTKVFHADPYTSNQRAELESNHRFIRRFLPESFSLSNLTQEHLDLMFSHINGVIRESQNNKTGYELAKAYLGEDFLNDINIKYVAPQDVILKPFLFDQLK